MLIHIFLLFGILSFGPSFQTVDAFHLKKELTDLIKIDCSNTDDKNILEVHEEPNVHKLMIHPGQRSVVNGPYAASGTGAWHLLCPVQCSKLFNRTMRLSEKGLFPPADILSICTFRVLDV